MAQQGIPPRRSARPPQPDYRGRRDRLPDRPRRDRPQFDAFGPDQDDQLPPWAGPNAYPPGTARRPGAEPGSHAAGRADEEYYDDRPGSGRPAAGDPGWRSADDSGWRAAGDSGWLADDSGWRAAGDSGWPADDSGRAPADDSGRAPAVGLADPPGRAGLPTRRGRAAATRLRKSRRRVYRLCGIAIAVCVVAAGLTAILTHHTPKPSLYVTSLLPGEFTSVPNACGGVSSTVLNQYLPGPGRTVASEIAETTQSQCTFTLDRKPDFLVLEVTAQAYQPFAAATAAGSAPGSASANAQDNYSLTQRTLAKPPKGSPLSAAQLSPLPKTGQQALVAVQAEHVRRISTEVVTVVIRERNVLIVVSESGQESGQGFGPVSVATLQAGAEAAARGMLAKSVTEPTA